MDPYHIFNVYNHRGLVPHYVSDWIGDPRRPLSAASAVPMTVPIGLLVNEGTASAAEVFAAALRDNGRAMLVGTRFGDFKSILIY